MLTRSLLLLGVGVWSCFFVPAALALGTSPLSQVAALAAGAAPVLLLLRFGHGPTTTAESDQSLPPARDTERELLQALEASGELTPVTAALRSSLTVDEAAALLDDLARRGHLQMLIQDGVLVYALHDRDRGAAPEPSADASVPASAPGPVAAPTCPRGCEVDETPVEPLSAREMEVLARLAAGQQNKEIARELVVSVGTVKTHTNNIYRKLGVRNRTEALARAQAAGIL
jgi:DNA-binding NarL/FixJ family response regulator